MVPSDVETLQLIRHLVRICSIITSWPDCVSRVLCGVFACSRGKSLKQIGYIGSFCIQNLLNQLSIALSPLLA